MLNFYDVEAIKEQDIEDSPAVASDQSRRIKLNATSDSSPLLASNAMSNDQDDSG